MIRANIQRLPGAARLGCRCNRRQSTDGELLKFCRVGASFGLRLTTRPLVKEAIRAVGQQNPAQPTRKSPLCLQRAKEPFAVSDRQPSVQ